MTSPPGKKSVQPSHDLGSFLAGLILSRQWTIFLSTAGIVHCLGTVSIESLKQADFHEQVRELGFEIIGEGARGLARLHGFRNPPL
jgi:hypothetical protein